MNVDGMTIIQGSKGSGKSATAVAIAMEHLRRGGVVAANFKLKDGWADVMARRHLWSYLSDSFRADYAASLYSRFFEVRNVESILSIDVKSLATGKCKTRYHKNGDEVYREGQGVLLLDECGLVFNSRKCMQGDKNLFWIEFFTQARKHGWLEILIAHKAEMIDSQIREMAEFESRFRNLQKVRIPFLGLPLSPVPLFLMVNRYAGLGPGSGAIHSRDLVLLPLWAARLYDSKLIFAQDQFNVSGDAIHSGPPPAPCAGGGLLPSPSRVHVSKISDRCLWSKYEELRGV